MRAVLNFHGEPILNAVATYGIVKIVTLNLSHVTLSLTITILLILMDNGTKLELEPRYKRWQLVIYNVIKK